MPKISIIIPVYNSVVHLKACIQSVLNQTFKDFEVILVDDGSTDGSETECDLIKEQDERVKVIRQSNSGAACARNVGVKNSIGEFVCFVDSDDYISPEYCSKLYSLLCKTECDFSVCGSMRVSERNQEIAKFNGVCGIIDSAEYLKAQVHRKSEFGFWNKMFRREIFEKLSFAPGRRNEDVIFSCDLAMYAKNKVVCTDEILYFYYLNDQGVTFQQKKRADPDMIYAGKYLVQTAKKIMPEAFEDCLKYAVNYPWSFVDRIYLQRTLNENSVFLQDLQKLIREYKNNYKQLTTIDTYIRYRMLLFSHSMLLYGINVYSRFARLCIYKAIGLDPYTSGHGV